MISVEEAWGLIEQNGLRRNSEVKPIESALNYVLAKPVFSKIDQPRANLSAMDGYAVRLQDVDKAGTILHVVDKVPAGSIPLVPVRQAEAVRVFTGSYIPQGADHVVIQEDVDVQGNSIRLLESYTQPKHIREQGLDFRAGVEIVGKDTRLGPMELLAIASANHAEVEVYSKPRVAILANGDELRPPGTDLEAGQIPNSNAVGLKLLIESWGGEVCYNAIARDSIENIEDHIFQIGDQVDVIVPIGGASVGEYDFMKQSFLNRNFESIFNKVAVKPGKPSWFFRNQSQRVLGLPGNPASAVVTAILFLKPLITGVRHKFMRALSDSAIFENGNRECFLRANSPNLNERESSVPHVVVADNQDSSLVSPLLNGNCLIRRESHAPLIEVNDKIEILPLE